MGFVGSVCGVETKRQEAGFLLVQSSPQSRRNWGGDEQGYRKNSVITNSPGLVVQQFSVL